MTDNIEITGTQVQDVTDVTDENSQLAQAATEGDTVTIKSPGPGQEVTIAIDPGMIVIAQGLNSVQMKNAVAQDGGSLIVTFPDGGIVILEDYLMMAAGDLPPQLTLADGTVISFDDLTASIEGFDPDAIAPAAGPGGGGAGNASFAAFIAELLGDGLDPTVLLDPTALLFGLLQPEQELVLVGEEELPTASAGILIHDETIDPLQQPSAGDDDLAHDNPAELPEGSFLAEVLAALQGLQGVEQTITFDGGVFGEVNGDDTYTEGDLLVTSDPHDHFSDFNNDGSQDLYQHTNSTSLSSQHDTFSAADGTSPITLVSFVASTSSVFVLGLIKTT